MDYKTAEQIARDVEHLDGLAELKAINKAYRAQDESHLWPISSKFNATDRAIRQARVFHNANGYTGGLEYCYMLDGLLTDIVNDPKL